MRTVRNAADGSEETVWRRPVTIPEYYSNPKDATRAQLYRSFDQALKPTLYHPWLMRNLDSLEVDPAWHATLRPSLEQAVPIMLGRPTLLFWMHRGGPHPPPEKPPDDVPPLFRNFFLEYSPQSFGFGYDESRMARAVWCRWLASDEFILQSFATSAGNPMASEATRYKWQSNSGLLCTAGKNLSGSYLTLPLDLINLTAKGSLTLLPPDSGSKYYSLTTNEKFWSEIGKWTDLL